jgi:hypothetical protein
MIDEDMAHAITYGAAKERSRAVFAQTDYRLIKDALMFYVRHNGDITDAETTSASNLLHRLGRIK